MSHLVLDVRRENAGLEHSSCEDMMQSVLVRMDEELSLMPRPAEVFGQDRGRVHACGGRRTDASVVALRRSRS